jgi:4-diphosphocytidyl-2-C-methyl-D-erythritol kinase
VPLDASNLILRAAALHAEASGQVLGGRFVLEKRIPMGAGLGGGSSDASAALLLLDQASEQPLGAERLDELASRIGSDCPLFLRRRAIVMRGRGEQVELLPGAVASRLKGQRVLLFKPDFGISTPWAYRQLAEAAPGSYLAPELAEARLERWLGDPAQPLSELLFNNMEVPAFRKYIAMPVLLQRLRDKFSLPVLMSGSGSCCFALLSEKSPIGELRGMIGEAWGEGCFIQETELS